MGFQNGSTWNESGTEEALWLSHAPPGADAAWQTASQQFRPNERFECDAPAGMPGPPE
jgi:hypothetical protein